MWSRSVTNKVVRIVRQRRRWWRRRRRRWNSASDIWGSNIRGVNLWLRWWWGRSRGAWYIVCEVGLRWRRRLGISSIVSKVGLLLRWWRWRRSRNAWSIVYKELLLLWWRRKRWWRHITCNAEIVEIVWRDVILKVWLLLRRSRGRSRNSCTNRVVEIVGRSIALKVWLHLGWLWRSSRTKKII